VPSELDLQHIPEFHRLSDFMVQQVHGFRPLRVYDFEALEVQDSRSLHVQDFVA
jgi:hypothetical protein